MVSDDIWIPTPDELDAEVAAERERRSTRRGAVRSASPERSGGTASEAQPASRRTMRIGGDVTRRAALDDSGPSGTP
jgi:hypothetical protein